MRQGMMWLSRDTGITGSGPCSTSTARFPTAVPIRDPVSSLAVSRAALVVPCRFDRLIRPQRPVFRRAPTVPGRATPGTELTSTTYRLTGHAGCWHKTSVASRTARSLPHRPALRDQVCVRWSATLIAPGVAGGDPRAQGLIAEPRRARRSAGSQPFRSRGLVSSGCSKGAGTIRP